MPRIQDEKLEQLINSAIKLIQPDGTVPYGVLLRFQQIVYLLSHYSRIIPFRDNTSEKQQFLCKVLKTFAGSPAVTAEQFEAAVEAELRRTTERGCLAYQVVFSVNLDSQAAELFKLALAVCPGVLDYAVMDVVQAQKTFNVYADTPSNAHHQFIEHRDRYTYCVIHQNASTSDEAIEMAGESFDLARAWVNFALCMFSVKTNFDMKQTSKCSPSYIVNCYDSCANLISQRQTMGDYYYAVPVIREGEIARARRFLEHVQTRPKTIVMDRMKSAMTLYGQALDEPNEAYQFFYLWQALEILLGTGDQQEMRARMKSLLPTGDISAALIEPLLEKRNKLIHTGRIRDFSDEDTAMLKNLADNVLVSILALSEKLKTNKQLEDFWDFWDLHEDELKRKRAVLDQILSTPKYAA